jgi:hypothetical protein
MGSNLISGQHPNRALPLNAWPTYSRVGSILAVVFKAARWVFDKRPVVRAFARLDQAKVFDRKREG